MKSLHTVWLFNKRIGWTLLWFCLLGLVAALINIVGISITGDIEQWNRWLKAHASIFLTWRIILYLVVAYGWYWMRQRVIAREENDIKTTAKTRFIRIELSAIATLVLLEVCHWMA